MTRIITICVGLLLGVVGFANAASTDVVGVRAWPAPDHTRIVFEISAPLEYKLFSLDDPDRIVIDLKQTRLRMSLPKSAVGHVQRVRSAPRNKNDLRIVLDTTKKVKPKFTQS